MVWISNTNLVSSRFLFDRHVFTKNLILRHGIDFGTMGFFTIAFRQNCWFFSAFFSFSTLHIIFDMNLVFRRNIGFTTSWFLHGLGFHHKIGFPALVLPRDWVWEMILAHDTMGFFDKIWILTKWFGFFSSTCFSTVFCATQFFDYISTQYSIYMKCIGSVMIPIVLCTTFWMWNYVIVKLLPYQISSCLVLIVSFKGRWCGIERYHRRRRGCVSMASMLKIPCFRLIL